MNVVKGIYRHFKGGIYEVIEPRAIDTETGDVYVVYKSQNGTVWVRPYEIFIGKVGNKMRFELLKEWDETHDNL